MDKLKNSNFDKNDKFVIKYFSIISIFTSALYGLIYLLSFINLNLMLLNVFFIFLYSVFCYTGIKFKKWYFAFIITFINMIHVFVYSFFLFDFDVNYHFYFLMYPIAMLLIRKSRFDILKIITIILNTSLFLTREIIGPQLNTVFTVTYATNRIINLFVIISLMFGLYALIHFYISKLNNAKNELEKLANYDSMTDLFNRRSFDRALNNLYLSFPKSENIYIAIIDIDYFKHINDQLGHNTGDFVLKAFSKELKKLIIEPNIACRWGGDEFALLFHGDKNSLEKMLIEVQKSFKKATSFLKIVSSLSIGVALWENAFSVEEVMKKADMKLYEAKSNGRNQYIFSDNIR